MGDQQREAVQREAEATKRAFQEAQADAAQAAERVFEAKRARVSQPEANAKQSDCHQVVIRTPSGKRISRNFLGSDDVSYVFDWIDVSCADEEFTKGDYRLVSRLPGRPVMEICKSVRTL